MGVTQRFNRAVERLFPERQLLLRTDGEIRFVTLGRRSQMTIAAALVAVVGWMTYATVGVALHERRLAERDARVAAIAEAYDTLTANMMSIHQRYEEITRDLEDKHQFLSNVLDQRTDLEKRLDALKGELRRTAGQRDQAHAMGQRLREQVTSLGSELNRALSTADKLEVNLSLVDNKLTEISNDRDRALRRVQNLNRTVKGLERELAAVLAANSQLGAELTEKSAEVASLRAEKLSLADSNASLTNKVGQLERRLSYLNSTQQTLIARLHERTNQSIAELETAVRVTGLDLRKLLARFNSDDGVGGPLIEFADLSMIDGETGTGEDAATLSSLETRLEHWNALHALLEIIPLSAPLDQYRLTSGYGSRSDPFTKRRAYHAGIDLAGPHRSKITATAPGVVTYAGWRGPYGRTIEIDHGHGIKTRYGHLRKIFVKKGQQVSFREDIGLMGSSGRSTGTHVHYEILFDGKTLNPMHFIEAGRNVFKQG